MQPIAETLARVTLGAPAQFKNLTVVPLFAPPCGAPGYVLLDESLAKKTARVTEISESGRVPELLFHNDGDEEVLLVDGEELVGARQNRILNVSILVGAQQKIVVPVSCVEQGRWRYKSRDFASAGRTLFSRARAKKMRHVSASLREHGSRYSNQTEIWSDISAKAAFLRVDSETEAMSDIFEQRAAEIEDYVKAFAPLPGQAGALFAINGKVAGLELFDAEAPFRKFMAWLVRGYAVDAIEEQGPAAQVPVAEVVRRFIDEVQAAALERFPALGRGEDLRLESRAITGGALYADGRVVHLCTFPVAKSEHRPIGRGGTIDFDIPTYLRRSFRAR